MKKALLALSIAAVLGTLFSCKKSDSNSAKGKLLGTWYWTQEGMDLNSNGIPDPSEIEVADTVSYKYFTSFFNDGTGYDLEVQYDGGPTVLYIDTIHFKWSVNGDKLVVNTTEPAILAETSIVDGTNTIKSATSSTLTLRTQRPDYNWAIFTKK